MLSQGCIKLQTLWACADLTMGTKAKQNGTSIEVVVHINGID